MGYARAGHVTVKAHSRETQNEKNINKDIATEVPVALVYNGVAHAVMMVTPLDLEDFALGFSMSEGIIEHTEDMLSIEIREEDKGLLLTMQIPEESFIGVLRRKRNLTGSTSCSLCGIESLEEAIRPISSIQSNLKIPFSAIYKAYGNLHEYQPEKLITGAVHGAAFVDTEGNIILAREDVGRHNALDKVIGAATKENIDPQSGFVLLTSRCSFEMVQKTVAFGAPVLIAISAPTTLAVELAEDANLTLVALARKENFTVFSHAERIT